MYAQSYTHAIRYVSHRHCSKLMAGVCRLSELGCDHSARVRLHAQRLGALYTCTVRVYVGLKLEVKFVPEPAAAASLAVRVHNHGAGAPINCWALPDVWHAWALSAIESLLC